MRLSVDLQRKFDRTDQFAEYEHLEDLASEDHFEVVMGPRLEAFEQLQHERSASTNDSGDSNDEEEEELDLFEGYCGEFSKTTTQLQSPYRRDLDPMIVEFEAFLRLLQGLEE